MIQTIKELIARDWDYSRIADYLRNEGYSFDDAVRVLCRTLQEDKP